MSSTQRYGTIGNANGDLLTAAFGVVGSGWTTNGIQVGPFDKIQMELLYTPDPASAATVLTLKPLMADIDVGSLDDYADHVEPDNTSALQDKEFTLAVGLTPVRKVFPYCTEAVSFLRWAARVDDATNPGTLVMRYLGHSNQGGQLAPNNVA